MKLSRVSFNLSSAAVIMIAAFSVFAQEPSPSFDRPQTFDAQHYTIRASFDRLKKKVFGDTTVTLKPLKAGFKTVELDAVALKFTSVKLAPSGVDLRYKTLRNKVIITLDKEYGPDDLISIRLIYSALPKKGVYFVPSRPGYTEQIWSQGQPEEARHWFPSFDFPSDKATSEEYITAKKGETVIGNGEFLGKTENADGTFTWHYKMPVPHSTYLVSFVIGKFVKVEDRYNETPLGFYVYPGKESTALKAFGDTKKMIASFEQLTGVPFPFNKYDQTTVSLFAQFSGMENITATTLADTDVYIADYEAGREIVMDLVSHELAHSWFGDLVTCRNWAELWLNEGFATYMEAVYREKTLGRKNYLNKIQLDTDAFLADDAVNKKRHGLFNFLAGDVDDLFDNSTATYNKGSVVLHMLREQIGDEVFWRAVNLYLNRHKFSSVVSTDLQKAMEETSGQDLKWFFDQWVYGGGAPKLEVKPSYDPQTQALTVTFAQTQLPDTITPAAFRLPLDLTVATESGETTEKVELTQRIQTFTFKIAGRPTSLTLDKDQKVALKIVRVHPLSAPKP